LGTLLASRDPNWETIDKMECIYQTEVPGLHVLPAGALRGDITTLLFSSRCSELFALLRSSYDMVIIDCPPMLQLADARILGLVAEGVIMVLRSGKTTREEASIAIERLRRDCIQVLGTILNDWNPRNSRTSNYSQYNYYRKYRSYYTSNEERDVSVG
jgi:succinoglycan biosynthesis transport protein ExoP